jgi:DNA replication and repair protein RecF
LSARTTVFFGANGQGKTNFLEACYLLCTLRPLRAQKLSELVRLGSPEPAKVAGQFELAGGLRKVELELSSQGRNALLDGKRITDTDEIFGGLATVAFTPDDLAVVKLGPEGRRRLLDRAVQNRIPSHVSDARDYLKALRSRNHLLRQRSDPALLESFDEPLAKIGTRIRQRRLQVLEELKPHATKAFEEVARGESALQLRYVESGGDNLAEALMQRRERDQERGYTSAGPHADDLSFSLGEKSARLYASQGQTRAIVLAFKIGEIENLRAMQGRAPLLLLDDVSSELDPERSSYLMAYLAALKGQVVLTCTDPRILTNGLDSEALFRRVSKGSIEPVNQP